MYQKEIVYIGLYKGGSRVGNAGFLKVENKDRESRMYLKIQNIPLGISGRFPIRVYNGSDWKELSSIAVQDGGGKWEETVMGNVDHTVLIVSLSGGYTLEGRSKSAPEISVQEPQQQREIGESETDPAGGPATNPTISQAFGQTVGEVTDSATSQADAPVIDRNTDETPKTVIITEELPRRSPDHIDIMPQRISDYSLKEDKWEQILDMYEQIHPYGDERVYVKLEPKDFVILQSKYQHLVNNSFLLHGFYNYRYTILGKEQSYYLGVPGVFYEREKMVAQMFGFEAFECPGGNVKAGEFGYYLRKVEL